MNKISKSLISKNKAISLALLMLYTLVISLLVATSCVASSFDKTFNDFFDDYKVFDILVTTKGTPSSLVEELEDIDGVNAVSGKLSFDKCVEFENGRTLLTRIMSEDSNDNWKMYDVNNNELIVRGNNRVMVSAYFAKCNDIEIGSTIKVINNDITTNLVVTDIVSSPETIGVGSYVGSWYDMRDFGFVYVSKDLIKDVFMIDDLCNVYKILVDDAADIEKIENSVKDIIPEDMIIEISNYKDSNIKKQLDYSIDTVKAITLYLPLIIIVIGVLFSLLFIYQVTRKSRKDIALLRAIGYSKSRIRNIFNIYVLIISIAASIMGLLFGFVILKFIINIYKDFYYLPYVRYDGNILKTSLIIIVINVLALISCNIACRDVCNVEPAIAFGDNDVSDDANLPNFISSIKSNPFTKLSITMIYRNKARVFVVFLCSLACMILTMLSVSIIINKNTALNYTFRERYNYDLAVFCSNEKDLKELANQEFVKSYDYAFQNDFTYEDDVLRIEAHEDYDDINGIILERGFARRHNLKIGDSIEIKGNDIEVVDIRDQYLCSTQYISFDTAKKLGYLNPNAIEITLKDNKINEALSYAGKLDSFLLAIDINSIELCAQDTMERIDAPCYMIIAFSLLIGFIIMYNMALISFDKRRKEFSTLRAIGTDNYRIIKLLLGESIGELIVAGIVAPISFPLLSLILTLISSTSEEYVLFAPFLVLVVAILLTLIYTLLGVFMTYLSIRKIDIALELNK